ncbi:MAG: UvrB/UvrC motif-containing protein [Elusimicrobiota bacterium]
MLCELCNKRKATVLIKKIDNGEKIEYNLCEKCASQISRPEINLKELQKDIFSSISDMLAGFSSLESYETEPDKITSKKCPGCGLTFKEFQDSGQFGCPECYQTFSDELIPLLKRLQGSVQHAGKSPPGKKKLTEINKLREELDNAVAKEDYERAAVIRDKIKEVKEKNGTSESST